MVKSKAKVIKNLDLSGESGVADRTKEFSVTDYDYEREQSGKSAKEAEFEKDLEFLLKADQEQTGDNKQQKISKANLRKVKALMENESAPIKKKTIKVKIEEITGDIDEIDLSDDDDENDDHKAPKAEANGGQDKVSKGEEKATIIKSKHAPSTGTTEAEDAQPNQKSKIKESSETGSGQSRSKDEGKEKSKKSKNLKSKKNEAPPTPTLKSENSTENGVQKSETQSERAGLPELLTKHKKKKKKEKKSKYSSEKDNEATGDNNENLKETPTGAGSPKEKERSSESSETAEASTNQLKQAASLRKASSKMAILPEVEPVSTIIGLSQQQILTMRSTDVKFKTLISVPKMSKMCRNVLNFVMTETDGFFRKDAKKSQFLQMCVMVALKESKGFHEIRRKFPYLLEDLSGFRELNLDHTRTQHTESSKQAHMNNFDYSVMSYIGHVIIWLAYCQRKLKKPQDVLRDCGLDVTNQDIVRSIGGYHLWDRIRRDERTMNNKRWKHVQKFRNNFNFEEHQFVVIVRFMNLDVDLST